MGLAGREHLLGALPGFFKLCDLVFKLSEGSAHRLRVAGIFRQRLAKLIALTLQAQRVLFRLFHRRPLGFKLLILRAPLATQRFASGGLLANLTLNVFPALHLAAQALAGILQLSQRLASPLT